jgi:hypothetical protein
VLAVDGEEPLVKLATRTLKRGHMRSGTVA